MAEKIPLYADGVPRQFEATDTIPMENMPDISGNNQYYGTDGSGTKGTFALPSNNPNQRSATLGETIGNGKLAYISAADTVMMADANALAKAAIAFVQTGASSGASVTVNYGPGIITGLSGGTAGAAGYLSAATPGAIVTTPPTVAGGIQQPVGYWLTTTVFFFMPGTPIKLAL